LKQTKAEGKKQSHTAKRIFERLRDEHRYTGGYRSNDYSVPVEWDIGKCW
jgi:hypothetical protein